MIADDAHGPGPMLPPDHISLRLPPPAAVRVRRAVVIGLSAFGGAAIIGITAFALRPAAHLSKIEVGATPVADRDQVPEALAGAPASYSDVPTLGPPLSGLAALGMKPGEKVPEGEGAPHLLSAQDAAASASTEAPGAAQALKSARSSPILAQVTQADSGFTKTGATVDSGLPDAAELGVTNPGIVDATANATGPSVNDRDDRTPTLASALSTAANALQPPPSRWLLSAGSVIAASLVTGIDSDLPGEIVAQVTANVYDSPTGHILLIPQGARLIGKTDSHVIYGQRRALIAWQRVILPDGSSISVDDLPATDEGGYVGLRDTIDSHGWALLKGVALGSALDIGPELSFGRGNGGLARALRQSVEDSGTRAAEQITGKNLDVQPTIRVRPGWPVRVIVREDLVLKPWRSGARELVP